MEDSARWIEFLPFTPSVFGGSIALVVLLLLSAFATAAETAFFSLLPDDVNALSRSRSRRAKTALRLLGMEEYLLATTLIVRIMAGIAAIITANSVFNGLVVIRSLSASILIKTILFAFLLLLFGEIMPKLQAKARAREWVLRSAVPLIALQWLLRPLSWLLIRSGGIAKRLPVRREGISMDEISNALEITGDQSAEEKRILSGIANFVNTEVQEIMRPRVDMVAIDAGADFPTVRRIVTESGFSRIPVYQESLDNIKGILYVKDLLPYLDSDFAWLRLLREAYFVPEHKKINDLFTEFQNKKIHIAIVVDEYGSTMGLVSLEDILEEVIGEISDESDADRSFYTRIGPDDFLFEGKTHILDFLKVVGLDDGYLDPYKGDSETIAGVMLEAKRDFLKVGDAQRLRNLTMTVDAVEGRRVSRIRVQIDRSSRDSKTADE